MTRDETIRIPDVEGCGLPYELMTNDGCHFNEYLYSPESGSNKATNFTKLKRSKKDKKKK